LINLKKASLIFYSACQNINGQASYDIVYTLVSAGANVNAVSISPFASYTALYISN
jgi:hypothetical protein